MTCSDGSGKFETTFGTGVTVSVGAVSRGGLSTRTCTASLEWDGQKLMVASHAGRIGIDVLGADLGLGGPVVAFQIRHSDVALQSEYRIYSLQKPPRLLRTLTGGETYSAADTYLDGQVEIWTDDASGVDGFDGLPAAALDFAPTVVLRFEKRRLMDVSAEFRSRYDQQIAAVRDHLDAQELSAFRNSDGKLPVKIGMPLDQYQHLWKTKMKVLEIVWSYLYSGREQEAWKALDTMWPPSDLNRIRAAIENARGRGILREVDGVAPPSSRWHWKMHVTIYDTDAKRAVGGTDAVSTAVSMGGPSRVAEPVVTAPKPILLRGLSQSDILAGLPKTQQWVDLVIDAAGKVRSVKNAGNADKDILAAAEAWHFIPAFKDGSPVACRFRMNVWYLK
ncbi:MAG TPA: hypothetical protein VND90_02015 [Terracidiphilus sp.]|nr:hypothetical protein [Terracidiphilus sp.]